ncbi:hypothetical protein Mapa_005094 [Marchantia paleacea]|nr:hypothetical protein Mapa_005094 [Marchantia paleacea]
MATDCLRVPDGAWSCILRNARQCRPSSHLASNPIPISPWAAALLCSQSDMPEQIDHRLAFLAFWLSMKSTFFQLRLSPFLQDPWEPTCRKGPESTDSFS